MKFITAKKPLKLGFFGYDYELGPLTYPEVNLNHILAAPDPLAETLAKWYPDSLQVVYFEAEKLPGFPRRLVFPPQDLPSGTRLMIMRDSGIGDMIMLNPALKALKKGLTGGVTLSLATPKARHGIPDNLGLVEALFPLPLSLFDFMNSTDYYFEFTDPKGIYYKTHLIDFYLDSFSLDYTSLSPEEKLPSLNAGLLDSVPIKSFIRERSAGKITVFHAPGASDPWRRIPPHVLNLLAGKYPDIVFFVPGDDYQGYDDLGNIVEIDTSAGLKDFASAVHACDITVSADSAAFHVAAALGRPSLVLFGPIHPAHARYYPLAVALGAEYKGDVCTMPCSMSGHAGRVSMTPLGANRVTRFELGTEIVTFSGESISYDESKGCPEANVKGTPFSPCLHFMPDERILDGFEKTLRLIAG